MENINFKYKEYSLEEIKRLYYLDYLCFPAKSQVENVAITLQTLFYLFPQLDSCSTPSIQASLSKTINILSYSVIDAIVILLGIKMQKKCEFCRNKGKCKYYSNSIFQSRSKTNEFNAFKNAKEYLMQCQIINLNDSAEKYFNDYRDIRNYVHITKNGSIMTDDSNFTKEKTRELLNFMQQFFNHLKSNYDKFLKKNGCHYYGI